jgi:predicted enzyme related to lactoylglutathione lyase
MEIKIGRVVILVHDYDEVFKFYEKNFFCKKLYDETTPDGQRFLHISFPGDESTGIWFLKADSTGQEEMIGKQTAGQPTVVLYTDDIDGLYRHLQKNGVHIIEEMVESAGSKFFHCLDLYGNRLTIVQLGV